MAFAVENLDTNPHAHLLMGLAAPGRKNKFAEQEEIIARHWSRLVRRGSCDVQQVYDVHGVVRYNTKQLLMHYEKFILLREFHSFG